MAYLPFYRLALSFTALLVLGASASAFATVVYVTEPIPWVPCSATNGLMGALGGDNNSIIGSLGNLAGSQIGNQIGGTLGGAVGNKIGGVASNMAGGGTAGLTSTEYACTITPGFGMFMQLISGFIKYATFLTVLVGILMLVVSGVRLSLSGVNKDMASGSKEMITKILIGLVFLFLISFILNTVAPWIYH